MPHGIARVAEDQSRRGIGLAQQIHHPVLNAIGPHHRRAMLDVSMAGHIARHLNARGDCAESASPEQ